MKNMLLARNMYKYIFGHTSSILVMLLAPKILWTQANLCGLVGGKYGERTQSLGHLLLKDLQAAHLVEWDCKVTNCSPNPKGIGYEPNKPNTINL